MNFLLGFLIVLIIYSGVAGFYSPVIPALWTAAHMRGPSRPETSSIR